MFIEVMLVECIVQVDCRMNVVEMLNLCPSTEKKRLMGVSFGGTVTNKTVIS